MTQCEDTIRHVLILLSILGAPMATAVAGQGEFTVPLDLLSVEIDGGPGDTAEFVVAGAQWLNLPGEPQIPWQVVSVLLPQDAVPGTVAVDLSRAEFDLAEGRWNVAPAPSCLLPRTGGVDGRGETEAAPADETYDAGIYGADAFWPPCDVKLIATGKFRQWKIAQATVPLFHYNPIQKRLHRLVRGELRIRFERALQIQADAGSGPPGDIGEDILRAIVVNCEQQAGSYRRGTASNIQVAANTKPGYAIVTTTDILAMSGKLGNFIAHKEARGFNVRVVTEEDFGGGVGDAAAENIRNWLRRNYRMDNILYVLLIGNPHPYHGRIPMKMLWPMNDGSTTCLKDVDAVQKHSPSDYYYADLTGNWDLDDDGLCGEWSHDFGAGGVDRCWDVLIGRIPCYEQAVTGRQVLYDSGPAQAGMDAGGRYYAGFWAGNLSGGPQTWVAQPFSLPTTRGQWHITCIGADYWLDTYYDRDFDLVGYIVWRREGQSKPREADIVARGTVPAPLHEDDPGIPRSENWWHHIQVSFDLPPGDYYLTIYGERSDGTQGCALAWMRNTESGVPLVDPVNNPNPGVRAFVWRSEMFPYPGFQAYNEPSDEWSEASGDDPLRIYAGAFTIYGEPASSGGTTPSTSQAPDVGPLDHILSKIMSYENTPEHETQWRKKMLLVIEPDDDLNPFFYRMGEEIKSRIIAFKGGWSCFRIYERDYDLISPPEFMPCTVDNVVRSWKSSPFGVAVWHTHGGETRAIDVIDHLRAAELDDRHPAFTFQVSCLTAHPETVDNLAYTLLRNGAVSTVGATRTASALASHETFAGTPFAEGLAIEYLTRLIQYEHDAGHALCDAKRMLAPVCNLSWLNWCDYNLYGCPAVGVHSCTTDSGSNTGRGTNR